MSMFFPAETYDGYWKIEYVLDEFVLKGDDVSFYFTSSYNVPPARLMGFTYPEYLRYCCAHGAHLKGRQGYIHPVWIEKSDCKKVCDTLEKLWTELVNTIQFD